MTQKGFSLSGSIQGSLESWAVSPVTSVKVTVSPETLQLLEGMQGEVRTRISDLEKSNQPVDIVDAQTGEILFENTALRAIRQNSEKTRCFDKNHPEGAFCKACPLGMKILQETRASALVVLQGRSYEISHIPVQYGGREAFIQYYHDRTEEESQKKLIESLIETASEGFLMVDLDFRLNTVNGSLSKILGFSREELAQMSLFDLVNEENRKILEEQMQKRGAEQHRVYRLCLQAKDGRQVFVNVSATTQYNSQGKVVGSYAFITDLTEDVALQRQLEDSNAEHEHLFEHVNEAIVVIEDTKIARANSRFFEILGYSKEEIEGMALMDLDRCFTDEKNREIFKQIMKKALREGNITEEVQALHKDGRVVDVEVSVSHVKHGGKRLTYGIIRDITQRKEMEKRLKQLAVTDGLTGIPNRRKLDEILSIEFNRALRNGEPLACLMIDADKFKDINDLWSHDDGDTTLLRLARCLSENIRTNAGDFVARYGGEEFTILLPNCTQDEALLTAERIRSAVKKMKLKHPTRETVSISIGIAMMSQKMANPGELVNTADKALLQAKNNGRDRVEIKSFE